VAFLEVTAPKAVQESILTIDGPNALRLSIALPSSQTTTIRLALNTDSQSRVRLDFRVSLPEGAATSGPESVGLGVASLTYVSADDGIGRVAIIERAFFEQKWRFDHGPHDSKKNTS
jgi:hypothetical protein